MPKILYEVETEAKVTRWYLVTAESEDAARQLVAAGGQDMLSEEVVEETVTNAKEEFDQDALEDFEDDDDLEPF